MLNRGLLVLVFVVMTGLAGSPASTPRESPSLLQATLTTHEDES